MFYLEITALILISLMAAMSIIGSQLARHPSGKWWVRMWDFPRYQLAIFAAIALVGFGYYWWPLTSPIDHPFPWIFLGLLVGAIIYQLYRIYPYTPFAKVMSRRVEEITDDRERIEQNEVSILVSNVYMYNRDYDRLLSLVRDTCPAILLALETDGKWVEALDTIQDTHPYRVAVPLHNTYGMVLYSRLPLDDVHVRYIIEEGVPSIRTRVCLPSGEHFTFYAVHPIPPYPRFSKTSLKRDVELIQLAREIDEERKDEPVIVAGDLNDVAWSDTTRMFLRLSKLLDPRCGRGLFNTFHTRIPPLRVPLDHIFHSRDFYLLSVQRMPSIGSDHFPMYIRLSLLKEAASQQKPLQIDQRTVDIAETKLKDAEEHGEIPLPERLDLSA